MFNNLFAVPAIPATINGVSAVAFSGQDAESILASGKATSALMGRALVFAIVSHAFGGKGFVDFAPKAKGHGAKIRAALQAGAPLPHCRGGKDARHLTSEEVQVFIAEFKTALDAVPVAVKKTPTFKIPEVQAFIEKYGKDAAHVFAVSLLGATGGVLPKVKTEPKVLVKTEPKVLAKTEPKVKNAA